MKIPSLDNMHEAFLGPEPPPRIIGAETEYIVKMLAQQRMLKMARSLYGAAGNLYLRNGALLYPDLDNAEYSTQEALGPLDAAGADHAGINMMASLYRGLNNPKITQPLRRSGAYCSVPYIAADGESGYTLDVDTAGYHENYLIALPEDKQQEDVLVELVNTFITTRPAWNGAGLVRRGGSQYLSQKLHAAYEKTLFALHTGVERVGSGKGMAVVEARTSDPHMLPYASYLGFAAFSLMLRLGERGIINKTNSDDWVVDNAYRTVHDLEHMTTEDFEATFLLRSGERLRAIDYQLRLAQLAWDFAQEVRLPRDEAIAAVHWLRIMESIANHGFDDPLLFGKVEHATKERLMRRSKKTNSPMDRVRFDLAFTQTDQRIVQYVLSSGPGSTEFDDLIRGLARQYMKKAPKTRARRRAALMKQHASSNDFKVVNWSEVIIDGRLMSLSNPYVDR